MLIDNFENPPSGNRPRPFWFFNGDMDRDEIRHQILEMKDKGLGGFFICARQGLRVPYLSEEWFSICKYAVDIAAENGLEVWLYDEYPYPSGMAGGEVTIQHPEAKQKILDLKIIDLKEGASLNESMGEGSLISALAFTVVNGSACWDRPLDISAHCGILQNQEIYQKTEGGASYTHNFKRYFSYGPSKELRWTPKEGRWKIMLAFTREIDDFKYYRTFVDPANEDAVQCFIDTSHERYKAALGKYFGTVIQGMFGDETSFLGRWPWSPQLPEYFQKRYGVSLVENLAALVDKSYPKAKIIRYQYFQCVHELLRDRYHKPISEWCEKNNIRYVTEVPSIRMSNQMYSHVPAGDPCHDKLGFPFEAIIERDFHSFRGNPKAISAMARQFKRRDALVEAFHSMGWTATLQDMKWQIDRLTLAGISIHNFHAFYYTLNGITKHDAPPSQFLQNPYWEYYKTFADYCGRSSRFITETEASISVAILHPAIAWCTELRHSFHHNAYIGNDEEERKQGQDLIDGYKYICKTLLFNQIDYEDLDPEVMAMAKIENGTINVGRAKYTTLIIPPTNCIEKYCFDLIQKFLESGGHVIFVGLTPFEVIEEDFDPATAIARMKSERLAFINAPGGLATSGAGAELVKLINAFNPPKVELLLPAIPGLNEGIVMQRREKGDMRFVMLASQNGAFAETKLLFKECQGDEGFYEMDLETGATMAVDFIRTEQSCLIDAPLSPWSARIFVMAKTGEKTGTAVSAVRALTQPPEKTLVLKLDLEKQLPVSIKGGNVYRFEEMQVSIAEGKSFVSKPNTFIEHLKESGSLSANMLKFSTGFGIPQSISVKYPLQAAYHFEFFIADELFSPVNVLGNIRLLRDCMGIMGEYTITINGKELNPESWNKDSLNPDSWNQDSLNCSRIYDQNNITADVSPFLKAGLNTLDILVTATKDWHGLSDPLYLLGDFGVIRNDGKYTIRKIPATAIPSAKVVKGFPFYSGKFFFDMELSADNPKDYERFTIEIPEKYRIYECVELSLNGNDLGVRAFSPYIWQGPASILKQANKLRLTITNTLGNMLEGCYYDYDEQKTVFID